MWALTPAAGKMSADCINVRVVKSADCVRDQMEYVY
jgi:hypothetical protein